MGIEHMLYVPYLRENLLSVVTFEDEAMQSHSRMTRYLCIQEKLLQTQQ
jgi:hypothetical protein